MVRNVRGKAYMATYYELRGDLLLAFQAAYRQHQKVTASDVGRISQQFDLPVKTTFEYLEYMGLLPSGTWERLSDGGVTAGQVIEAANSTPEATGQAIASDNPLPDLRSSPGGAG